MDNLYAAPVFYRDIEKNFDTSNIVIISPDVGGVVRDRSFANRLNASLAIFDIRRVRAGVSVVMNIIGDIKGRDCIIIDDIVDSAGTLCNGAAALDAKGANSVFAYVTHGVLSGKANERIKDSVLTNLVITDSIKPTEESRDLDKIKVISMAPLMGEAIKSVAQETSVSRLFY